MTAAWLTFIGGLVGHLVWPTVVLVVAFRFQTPLSQLLGRMISFEAWGAKALTPLTAEKEQAEAPIANQLSGIAVSTILPEVNASAATVGIDQNRLALVRNLGRGKPELERRIKAIEGDMRALGLIPQSDEATQILLRHLAAVNLGFKFERAYRFIFGSQMTALSVVRETGPHKMEVLRPFYENARDGNPQFYGAYTFEQWVGFLVREEFIAVSDGMCSITEIGKEFLLYATEVGFPPKQN